MPQTFEDRRADCAIRFVFSAASRRAFYMLSAKFMNRRRSTHPLLLCSRLSPLCHCVLSGHSVILAAGNNKDVALLSDTSQFVLDSQTCIHLLSFCVSSLLFSLFLCLALLSRRLGSRRYFQYQIHALYRIHSD